MNVANRLRGAFALYVVLLVALAMFYARTVQRAADGAQALSGMAERVRATNDQLFRIDEMSADAEKYTATRDVRYRERFALAFREFGSFEPRALQPAVLDSIRMSVSTRGIATQDSMRAQLIRSDQLARRAASVSLFAVAAALLLGVLLSAMLMRSIERMKKDFVARVSHDLKTPLSSMQETNRALLDDVAGPLTDGQRRLLELNFESGHRLSVMLGKLLDLSRIEAGLEPAFQVVDVNAIAKESVHAANASAAHRGVRLSLTGPDRPALVNADPTDIARILDNLVENAIKFSPADGTVAVRITEEPTGDAIALAVTDEGPGIRPDDRERVFERFYQTDAGRAARNRGAGLGLTICREIVARHGGKIWVDANRPRGSVFHVLLRRSIAAAAAIMVIGTAGCARSHARTAELTTELAAVRARLDSVSVEADSLRMELQRLKEIDLKPRAPTRRPPTDG